MMRFPLSFKSLRPLLLALMPVAMMATTACSLIGPTLGMGLALAPLKLTFACLPEGTQIDTPGGSVPIESLRAGDLVLGYDGEPVRVQQIHGYMEDMKTDFYHVSFSNGGVVDLCSMHRIGGIRAKKLTVGSVVSGGHVVTEIEVYRGVERSYDILTEDSGYQVGGVPVNSMIEEMFEAGRAGVIEN